MSPFTSRKENVGWHKRCIQSIFCSFPPPAVAEVGDSLGAPRLSVLSGFGDGSGRDGLLSDARHQPLWTECVHAEMGSPFLLTSKPVSFHLQKPTLSPIHSLRDRGRDKLLGHSEDAWARHVKELHWGRLNWRFMKTFGLLFTVFHEKESRAHLSGLDKNIARGRVTSETSVFFCLQVKVCLFEEESNQVHLKTLTCRRFELDRNFALGKTVKEKCLVSFCNESVCFQGCPRIWELKSSTTSAFG